MNKRVVVAASAVAVAVSVGGAVAGEPPRKPSAFDRHFVIAAAQNDTFEIAVATVARRRGQSEELCDAAARLITDHRRSLSHLRTIAQPLRIALPRRVNPFQGWAIREVSNLPATVTTGGTTGATFTAGFSRLQVAAHRQAIQMFTEGARLAEHPRVRAFARAQLPILRTHLRMVEDIGEEQQTTAPAGCEDE